MSSVTIFQSDHFVLSTNFLFKFDVSLPFCAIGEDLTSQ